ncbi:MAG: hypothetical protein A3I06_05855 [Candidatus Lindowbacteria bacterium RIFCSPLOWO2_02_FULL_62_12]|nr:MAG: hypothetical protein A3I06_05855 [Candidatus Lindowbacteria bacterium RIFCSPLOWO2_02_FULL_62_12]
MRVSASIRRVTPTGICTTIVSVRTSAAGEICALLKAMPPRGIRNRARSRKAAEEEVLMTTKKSGPASLPVLLIGTDSEVERTSPTVSFPLHAGTPPRVSRWSSGSSEPETMPLSA